MHDSSRNSRIFFQCVSCTILYAKIPVRRTVLHCAMCMPIALGVLGGEKGRGLLLVGVGAVGWVWRIGMMRKTIEKLWLSVDSGDMLSVSGYNGGDDMGTPARIWNTKGKRSQSDREQNRKVELLFIRKCLFTKTSEHYKVCSL